tara:strand:+ start:263 stop:430 length:168 start_codon:yes stop_codon:yes gene_type:complete
MKIRINELAKALKTDTSDILAICAILNVSATTKISSLTIEEAKQVTDYFQKENNK